MRLLCLSVLVLLLVPASQAHAFEAWTEEAVLDDASLAPAHASGSPADPTGAVNEAQTTAEKAAQATQAELDAKQEELAAAKDDAYNEADDRRKEAHGAALGLKTLAEQTVHEGAAQAEDALRPGHALVQDAQDNVEGLLDPEKQEDEPEATPASNGAASVGNAWPEYAQPVLIFSGAAAGFGVLAWLLGQTATVGAGAAGTAAARDGRRFLPFASPLFTRFERDTVLGHPKREAIYGQIIGKPGVTLQDLCKESGLSRTAVTHHLRLLEQQHLVVSKRVGRSRHFFENGGRYGRNQKDAYAVLHNDRSKQIHAFISKHPGAIQKELCGAFSIQASVAHWHVKRLLEANLVEAVRQGRTVSYFPAGETPQAAYA